jgi:hypothetical protein
MKTISRTIYEVEVVQPDEKDAETFRNIIKRIESEKQNPKKKEYQIGDPDMDG